MEVAEKKKLMVPELRFKEFGDEWQKTTVGEATEFKNGKGHEQAIDEAGNFVVVNSKFVSTEGNVRKYTTEQICPLYKGDIAMVMSDIPKGKALAKCYYIEQDGLYSLNQRICGLSSDKNETSFLIHLINRNSYYLMFDSGVGQTNLRKDEVLDCPIRIPSLPEQKKIADFLSAVDARIKHLNRKKELLEQYKKGVMQKLFVQELRFKGFSEDFEECRLSQLLVRYSENNKDGEFNIDDILSLSSRFGIVDRKELLEDTYSKVNHFNYIKTRLNDFVYAKSISSNAPFGTFKANLCRDGLLSTLYFTFKVTKRADPLYLEYYFSDPHRANNYLRKFVLVGDRYITADADFILSGKIRIPSLPEQQKIADFLSALDKKIEAVSTQIAKTQQFKKGLLQKMFV